MRAALVLLLLGAAPTRLWAGPLLLISIDGLRPGDVLEAEARGIKVPRLTALLREGAYATSVRGVLPTVTYPSHTTLMTGVWPDRHGIVNNRVFDPLGKNLDAWYWYAEDVRVPTLWDAAHAAGLSTASVYWPVTVGSRSIDFNWPQIWRSGQPDDAKLQRALATPGLLDWLEKEVGPIPTRDADVLAADDVHGRSAERIWATRHPRFMTAYFGAIDEVEHEAGPGTPAVHAALERVDGYVGRLIDVARRVAPTTTVAVVSDHGFVPIHSTLQLLRVLDEAGLVKVSAAGKVEAWQARGWPSGGSGMVVLADPSDAALRAKVGALLARLAADPASGVARVIDQREIAARGGAPQAAFYLDMKPGFSVGDAATGPIVTGSTQKGTHGYFPEAAELRSTFIIAGREVPRHGSLGEIDMRDIAPTLAGLLKVRLPTAQGKPLF